MSQVQSALPFCFKIRRVKFSLHPKDSSVLPDRVLSPIYRRWWLSICRASKCHGKAILMAYSRVTQQEIPSATSYKNSFENREKLSFVFGLSWQCGNEWFKHDFYIQVQDGCQMCKSAVNWIRVSNKSGIPPADWVYGSLCFEPGAWIWTKGFRRLSAFCEKIIWNVFFKFSHGTCPWMAFAWNFSGFFLDIFLGRSVGHIIYREQVVFRSSNISCSQA